MKRLFDIIVAFHLLLVTAPIFLTVSILVWYKLGKPILFKQKRPGKDEAIFNLYKFRSMTNEVDSTGKLLPNNLRLTSFGRFLRSTSLDELPSLINVLKGEMSLVGPRPLLVDYLPFYNEEQARRHSVRPGITGWAQVNGRNAIDWDQKLILDVWYIDNQSLYIDLKILIKTIIKVLRRSDINYSNEVLMPRFDEYVMNKNYKLKQK